MTEFEICLLNMPSHLIEQTKKKPVKKKAESEDQQTENAEPKVE